MTKATTEQTYEITAADMLTLRWLTEQCRGAAWFSGEPPYEYETNVWSRIASRRDGDVFRLTADEVRAIRGGLKHECVPKRIHDKYGDRNAPEAKPWQMDPVLAADTAWERENCIRALTELLDANARREGEQRRLLLSNRRTNMLQKNADIADAEWVLSLSLQEQVQWFAEKTAQLLRQDEQDKQEERWTEDRIAAALAEGDEGLAEALRGAVKTINVRRRNTHEMSRSVQRIARMVEARSSRRDAAE